MARKTVRCIDCGFLSLLPPEEFRGKISELRIDFYGECTKFGREAVIQDRHGNPQWFACRRLQWSTDFPQKLAPPEIFSIINQERECLYFISYQPGYTPDEHRELQREKANRRTLLRASILGAAVGASAAIVAQVIWALFSS